MIWKNELLSSEKKSTVFFSGTFCLFFLRANFWKGPIARRVHIARDWCVPRKWCLPGTHLGGIAMSPPPVNSIRLLRGWRACAVDSLFVTSGSEWYSRSPREYTNIKYLSVLSDAFSGIFRKQRKYWFKTQRCNFRLRRFFSCLYRPRRLFKLLYTPGVNTDGCCCYRRTLRCTRGRYLQPLRGGPTGLGWSSHAVLINYSLTSSKCTFFKGGRRRTKVDKPGWLQSNLEIVEGK
jgi:hypothetical protein